MRILDYKSVHVKLWIDPTGLIFSKYPSFRRPLPLRPGCSLVVDTSQAVRGPSLRAAKAPCDRLPAFIR
jgi:hypothetical protein